jgi:regulatory protein
LKKRGLPVLAREDEGELEKARQILRDKFKKTPPFTYEEKPKVMRYLAYRGFDGSTIRKVMNERE